MCHTPRKFVAHCNRWAQKRAGKTHPVLIGPAKVLLGPCGNLDQTKVTENSKLLSESAAMKL
jgi:hypothetical protein